jgi:hypothetical protein
MRQSAAKKGYGIRSLRDRWQIIYNNNEIASVDKATNGDTRQQLNRVAEFLRIMTTRKGRWGNAAS